MQQEQATSSRSSSSGLRLEIKEGMESDEEIRRVPDFVAGEQTGPSATGSHGGAATAGTSVAGQRKRGRNPAEKEHRRLKRLLRNRVSAQQARERKKAYLSDLEEKVKELQRKNMELEERLSTVQNENQMLRQMSSGGAGGEQPSRRSILSFRRSKQTTRGPIGHRPDQAAGDSTPTPSPHSPAVTTPPPPPPPETQAPTPTQMDAAEDRRILITPEGDTFHPSKYVTPRITEIIKSLFDGPYYSWRKVPNQVQEIWFREFTKYFIWLPEHTDRVRKNFGTRCSCRLRDMFTDLRKSGQKPAWIGDDVWLQLLAEWAKPEYVQMREKNKQNHASDAEGSGTSLHTGGSIPHTEHRRRLRESLGREPTMAELYQRTHQRQSNKEWVDQKSSSVHSEYMRLREQSQASEGQASQTSDFDAWREAAGGKKKGRIYGLGSVGHGEGTSSQSAHSVDSSGSTIERMIQRAMDPFALQFEEHTRELTQLREDVARLRQRPNILEEDDEESTD